MICTEEDEFVFEQPQWRATLSDGVTVIQDDFRPGLEPSSAWLRLKQYCLYNSLYIIDFVVRFRSHWERIPSGKDGYFFCRCAGGTWGSNKTDQFYITGYLEDGKVRTIKWKVPEFVMVEEEVRNVEDCAECLILNG